MRATSSMSDLSEARSRPADGTGRLTRYYILALSVVALLSIAGQALVQSRLHDQLGDSRLVNIAGRQRMLSQRIVKCALLLSESQAEVRHESRREELRAGLETWRRCHDELRRGGSAIGLAAGNSPESAALFENLEPTFATMSAAARRIVAGSGPASADDLATLLAGEGVFLAGMDAIVAMYEREIQAKVARLRTLEWILLSLTLVTLLLEGFCVFRPAARQIRRSFAHLLELGEQLRTARDVAESASRAKSQFLANVSHELRTPLHAILGCVETADRFQTEIRNDDSDLRMQESLRIIGESARRQLSLVNDLLDLSRIEAGKLTPAELSFDLLKLVHDNAALIRPLAHAGGLSFRVDVAKDLPRFIQGDSLRISQVVTNLLANACKFTKQGEVELRVYVCRDASDRREIRCVVRDTGVGIPEDQRQRIFEPFAQVDEAGNRLRQGAGLGLAISKQLAELMGGRLVVESRVGEGSTFVFAWPCRESPDATPSSVASADESARRRPVVRSLRVLAVDDALPGRRVLEAMLGTLGHRATCAADGPATLAAYRSGDYDVVLLDLHMPNIDGRTTAAEIRAYESRTARARTPMVLVTADATSERMVAEAATEFDGFLLKPFSMDQLATALGAATQMKRPIVAGSRDALPANSAEERALARLGGNTALLGELIELFLAEGPGHVERLRRAVADGDCQAAFKTVHLLRGQLEMLESSHADVLRELEIAADQGDLVRTSELLKNVSATWPDVVQELGAFEVRKSLELPISG